MSALLLPAIVTAGPELYQVELLQAAELPPLVLPQVLCLVELPRSIAAELLQARRAAGHQAELLQAVELLVGGHQVAELPPLVLHPVLCLVELLRSIAAEPLHLVDRCAWTARAGGGTRPSCCMPSSCWPMATRRPSCCWHLQGVELLPLALHLVAAVGRRAAGAAIAAPAVELLAGVCLAGLLLGLQGAELLPLVLRLVDGAEVEPLAGVCRAELLLGLQDAELLPLVPHLVDGAGVELLGGAIAAPAVDLLAGVCTAELLPAAC